MCYSNHNSYAQALPASKKVLTFYNECIIPCKQGYIGLFSRGESSQLRLYDINFKQISSVQFQKLFPQDFSEDYILSSQAGQTQLFKIEYSPELSIAPIKHSPIFNFNKILFSSPEKAILYGSQGVIQINISGETIWDYQLNDDSVRLSLAQSSIIDAIIFATNTDAATTDISNIPSDKKEIIILIKAGSNILVRKIDVESGKIQGELELAFADSGNVCGVVNDRIFVFTKNPNTLYLLGAKSMLIENFININQDYSANFLISNRKTDDKLKPAFLTSTYPTPEIYFLDDETKDKNFTKLNFDYPLQSTVLKGFQGNNNFVITTYDSVAIFDNELEFLQKEKITLGSKLKYFSIDSTKKIIASENGTIIFSRKYNTGNKYLDLLKKYKTVFYLFLLDLLFLPIWLIYKRYRRISSVYSNIVKVPESGGVIVISKSQQLVQINNTAKNYLLQYSGIPEDIALKKHIATYLPDAQFSEINTNLQKLFANGTPFETKISLTNNQNANTPQAIQTLVFRGRPMISSLGFLQGYIVLIEDITKTIEKERLLNWASVAHHIAHGMKTPLGAIRLSAENLMGSVQKNILLEEKNIPAEKEIISNKVITDVSINNGIVKPYTSDDMRSIRRIVSQSEKLRSIVNDLMSVAKADNMKLVEVDLKLVVATIINEYEELIPSNISLRLGLHENDIHHKIDIEQFSVALKNIVDNSIQAIGERENGEISISLTKHDKIILVITDNGKGMNEHTLKNIFQPFYTDKQGGTGIGMVITKRVIEGLGGEIQIESKQGVGTKFIVSL